MWLISISLSRSSPYQTVREEDGLAMSSRNRYLSKGERQQGLSAALDDFRSGERNVEKLIAAAKAHLEGLKTAVS
ncbi:pantoate--beta-alanine ligase [Bradyrhizobium sp. PMVTL-01]|uniref:pantoate--beta-alanine ligase n=1 Tax=Bradyrhizobium sp. PMVTL-01 TaxID=3434999 RepID=UPI003F702D0F